MFNQGCVGIQLALNLCVRTEGRIVTEAKMNSSQGIAKKIMKSVGIGMPAAVLVLNIMNVAPIATSIVLLGLGLFALSFACLQDKPE